MSRVDVLARRILLDSKVKFSTSYSPINLFSWRYALQIGRQARRTRPPYQGSGIASPPQHSEMEPSSRLSLTSARTIGGKLTSGTGSFLSSIFLTALFQRTGTDVVASVLSPRPWLMAQQGGPRQWGKRKWLLFIENLIASGLDFRFLHFRCRCVLFGFRDQISNYSWCGLPQTSLTALK